MKPIYCNCSVYLGEHEGFNVIRCKNCGIDYIANPKEFWDYYKTNKVAIHTSTREDYENLIESSNRAIFKEVNNGRIRIY